ncbi:hypothetical protein D3C72_1541440 [compost metagenome]
MFHPGTGHAFEQGRSQVHRVANRPGAIVELAGAGLGIGDQVAHGLVGAVHRHADEEVVAKQRHQDVEILVQAVGQLLEEVRIGGDVHIVQLDHVGAVGGAALEGVNGDETVAARAVFHHHRLAPGAAELVGHQAREPIGPPADRKRVDDARRLGWPFGVAALRQCGPGCQSAQAAQREDCAAAAHRNVFVLHVLSPKSRCNGRIVERAAQTTYVVLLLAAIAKWHKSR